MTDSRVYVSGYTKMNSECDEFLHPLQSALSRRFSTVQKVSMEIFERLRHRSPTLFENVFHRLKAPLYFATSLGEVDSVTRVIKSVIDCDLPVSPIAFQHSVHNATAGHIAIQYRIKSPQLTFSSGFLSFDKALFFAYQQLKGGLAPAISVFAAAEYWSEDRFEANAEVCFLTLDLPMGEPEVYELLTYTNKALVEAPSLHYLSFKPTDDLLHCPLNLDSAPLSFIREVQDFDGEILSSVWQKLS